MFTLNPLFIHGGLEIHVQPELPYGRVTEKMAVNPPNTPSHSYRTMWVRGLSQKHNGTTWVEWDSNSQPAGYWTRYSQRL